MLKQMFLINLLGRRNKTTVYEEIEIRCVSYLVIIEYVVEASRGATAQGVTVKPTGCGFDPLSRRWNIYLNLYFHFLRSSVEDKGGVEFCYSTRNASRIRQKVGNGVS